MMKRRNFLGFLGGAAVAAPAMAQSAAQSLTTADLSLDTIGLSANALSGYPGHAPSGPDRAVEAMKALTEHVLRTSDQHQYFKRETKVYGLDADLASFKSFSLGTKVSIQRDRNYERDLEHKKQTMQGVLGGWLKRVTIYNDF